MASLPAASSKTSQHIEKSGAVSGQAHCKLTGVHQYIQGILIKGGDALERGAAVNVVVFDKTGTLTYGRPVVVGLKLLAGAAGRTARQLQEIVGSLESTCEHPMARALVAWSTAALAGPNSPSKDASWTSAAHAGDEDAMEVPGAIIQVCWPQPMHLCVHRMHVDRAISPPGLGFKVAIGMQRRPRVSENVCGCVCAV